MPAIYEKQRKFFKKAYQTGERGWPEVGPTAGVARVVKKLGPGRRKTALDLGCGEGRHKIFLARQGYSVKAVDLEPLALGKAREYVRRAGLRVEFAVANALDLRDADSSFDVVLDYGCFHHMVTRDWPRYRREIARVQRPGGNFVLSVFSMKFKHHAAERRTRNWLIHRNHYSHFFTPSEIRAAFAPAIEVRTVLEELEGLNGFYHALLRMA